MKPKTAAEIDLTFVRNGCARLRAPMTWSDWLLWILTVLTASSQIARNLYLVATGTGSLLAHTIVCVFWGLFLGVVMGVTMERVWTEHLRRAHGTWHVRVDELPPPVAKVVFKVLAEEKVDTGALQALAEQLRALGYADAADACVRRMEMVEQVRRASWN